MRSRGKIVHFEKALGFATELGISRQTSRLKGSPLVDLLKEIDLVKKDYEHLATDEVRTSQDLRAATYRIFSAHGAKVWPDGPYRVKAAWLASADHYDSESRSPKELFYSDSGHREQLYELFHSLVEEKVIKYRENQQSLKKRKAKARVSSSSDSIVSSPSPWDDDLITVSELTDFEVSEPEGADDQTAIKCKASPTATMSSHYRNAPSSDPFSFKPLPPKHRRDSDDVIQVDANRALLTSPEVATRTVNPSRLTLHGPNRPPSREGGGLTAPRSDSQANRNKRGRQDSPSSPSYVGPKRMKESVRHIRTDNGGSSDVRSDNVRPAAPPAMMSTGTSTTNNTGQKRINGDSTMPNGTTGTRGSKPTSTPLARITKVIPGPIVQSTPARDSRVTSDDALKQPPAGKAQPGSTSGNETQDVSASGDETNAPAWPGNGSCTVRSPALPEQPTVTPVEANDTAVAHKLPAAPSQQVTRMTSDDVQTAVPQQQAVLARTADTQEVAPPNNGGSNGPRQPGAAAPSPSSHKAPTFTNLARPDGKFQPDEKSSRSTQPSNFELPRRLKAYVYTNDAKSSPRVAILDYRVGIEAFFEQLDRKLGRKLLASGKTVESFRVEVREGSNLPNYINVSVEREDGEAEWETIACELVNVEGGEDFNRPKLDIHVTVGDD